MGYQEGIFSIDLHLEHLNRVCKEAIRGLGSKKTTKCTNVRIGVCWRKAYSLRSKKLSVRNFTEKNTLLKVSYHSKRTKKKAKKTRTKDSFQNGHT